MAAAKLTKVTVLLDAEEFSRLDRFCRERAYKKSTLVARLIRQFLEMEGYGPPREPGLNRFTKSTPK